MPLVFECSCGKKLKVRDELAGKKVKCPGCGKPVQAPAPVVEEEPIVEVAPTADVMVGEPPVNLSKGPPPAPEPEDDEDRDERDKDEDDDDDDEDDGPVPYWVFPGTLSTELMAIAKDGIWFASLKGDVLKKAKTRLEKGIHPSNVLGEKAYLYPWVGIQSIFTNKKLCSFTINYMTEEGTAAKVLTCGSTDERDDIFETIEKLHGDEWDRKVVKHNAFTAMISPIVAMIVTGAIAFGLAILSLFLGGDWEGRGRGAAVAALFNLIHWLGPLGNCGIGLIIILLFGIWMLVRMINPPLEVTLAPVPPKPYEDDDDD